MYYSVVKISAVKLVFIMNLHFFDRSFFIALFRHILNVGRKGCYRTALELCKLLLNLSPDDDPLAVSLMLDFYALRAQEYSWLVALYDLYEPTKNLSMVCFMRTGS